MTYFIDADFQVRPRTLGERRPWSLRGETRAPLVCRRRGLQGKSGPREMGGRPGPWGLWGSKLGPQGLRGSRPGLRGKSGLWGACSRPGLRGSKSGLWGACCRPGLRGACSRPGPSSPSFIQRRGCVLSSTSVSRPSVRRRPCASPRGLISIDAALRSESIPRTSIHRSALVVVHVVGRL